MATARTRTPAPARRIDPDHRLPAGEPEPEQEAGLAALLRSLATDLQTLVRQEIELAKLEGTRTAKRLLRDGAWIGAGVAILAVGGLVLVVALALGLGALLGAYWLGTLITGGLLALVGAGLAWKGARDLRSVGMTPRQTVDSLKEDAAWARSEAQEFKDEITRSA